MITTNILSQHGNDFTAAMSCEHCNAQDIDKYGYMDRNYFANVIPSMHCKSCGKNRTGDIRAIAPPAIKETT